MRCDVLVHSPSLPRDCDSAIVPYIRDILVLDVLENAEEEVRGDRRGGMIIIIPFNL